MSDCPIHTFRIRLSGSQRILPKNYPFVMAKRSKHIRKQEKVWNSCGQYRWSLRGGSVILPEWTISEMQWNSARIRV